MNTNIQKLREQSLLTCRLTEEYLLQLREQHRKEWHASLPGGNQAKLEEHERAGASSIALATVGLVGATGVAIAGGPVTLGFAAFAIGTAAAGKAIFHALAGKFHELRNSAATSHAHSYQAPSDDELELIAEHRGPALWDEVMNSFEIREISGLQQEQKVPRRIRMGR